jgi:hypothetical protein
MPVGYTYTRCKPSHHLHFQSKEAWISRVYIVKSNPVLSRLPERQDRWRKGAWTYGCVLKVLDCYHLTIATFSLGNRAWTATRPLARILSGVQDLGLWGTEEGIYRSLLG